MTAKELLQHQIDEANYQLGKVFEGVDASLDFKLTEQSMTPRETAIHLAECYTALAKDLAGEKHEWGTYVPGTKEWPGLWDELQALRSAAVAAVMAEGGDVMKGHSFIVGHDFYHVGQLCQVRLACDPGWDAYSIYNWG